MSDRELSRFDDAVGADGGTSTYEPGLISAKAFHDGEMVGFVQFLRMVHVHHGRGPVPTKRGIEVKAAGVCKVRHSGDCFQEPETRYGAIVKEDI